MKITIKKAKREDATILATLIKDANKEVSRQFGITYANNPKHPSFYTKKWVENDFTRGEEYFLLQENGINIACVAYESTRADTAYLNRLSVLSQHQNKGIGENSCLIFLSILKIKSTYKLALVLLLNISS